jgi:hypothetical protein
MQKQLTIQETDIILNHFNFNKKNMSENSQIKKTFLSAGEKGKRQDR